ncbi:MAG TPA: hypothetical protein VK668_21700 [Mucilaginibacter sp.]|nr:hypothetical protein [Mucilaginibacter sp.]
MKMRITLLMMLLLASNIFAQQKPTKAQRDAKATADAIKGISSLFKKKNPKAKGDSAQVGSQQTVEDKNLSFSEGTLSTGEYCSIILRDGVLYGWGDNSYGQSGVGKTQPNDRPIQITTDNDWKYMSAAEYHTIAIKTDGTLWAWGWGNSGELGMGVQNTRVEFPTRVGRDTNWMSVSCSDGHTVAIKTNGTLWTWGNNADARLGIGPTPNGRCDYPQQLGKDHDWAKALAGDGYTLAIKKDGSLWAWGFNVQGDLGTPTVYQVQQAPIPIGTDKDWDKLFAGWRNYGSFGIKRNGTLWAWGSNRTYQLGLDRLIKSSDRPMQVGTSDGWVSVSNGGGYTVGIKADGSVWHWGAQQLSGSSSMAIPQRLRYPGKWVNCAVGLDHAVIVGSDGRVWSWGGNYYGQLGVPKSAATGAVVTAPVAIRAFPVPVITTKSKTELATTLNEETKVLFQNTKSKLSVKDKNAIAKLLGFPLSRDKKQFILDKGSADYPFDILVYPTDLNKDGTEEIFITYGNTYTSGLAGSSVQLFIRDPYGDWHANLGFPGVTPDALGTGNAGYPDLLIGGPGNVFPVWRWNGKAYDLNRKVVDAQLKTLKASSIENVSKAYVNAAFGKK